MPNTLKKPTQRTQELLLRKAEHEHLIQEATKKIARERDKMTSIIMSLNDGIFLLDKSGRVLLINPRVEVLFKIKEANVLGKKINEIGVCDCLYKLFKEVSRSDNQPALLPKEAGCTPQKKKALFLNLSAQAVTDQGGQVIGYLLIAHDATRGKVLDIVKTEFISIAAHQLRTPLSAIKWALDLILKGDIGQVNTEARECLIKTFDTNERMIRLVNNLLDVSHIEEGRFVHNFTNVSLRQIIDSVVEQSSMLIKQHKLSVDIVADMDDAYAMKADEDKMRLAIQNILENAIKYSKNKGRITISFQRARENGKQYVQVGIKDLGIGISKKDSERIFTKFYRGTEATKLSTEGSGLGLFITKNIVDAHQGKIWFDSQKNQGTSFFIQLPVKIETNN